MPSGGTRTLKHGAILIATGAEEHRPEIHGLGRLETVMTQTDFEAALENQSDDGWRQLRVVMLQCAGSRDSEHLPYCSRVCCNHAVKNARRLKTRYPEARVDVLYRDMRCYGLAEIDYAAGPAGRNQFRPLRPRGKSGADHRRGDRVSISPLPIRRCGGGPAPSGSAGACPPA